QNCEHKFNKCLAHFSIFSKPLVKCIIREIGVDGIFFDGICLGHFCYLAYDLHESIVETYYYYGCWRVDGTNAIWNESVRLFTTRIGNARIASLHFACSLVSLIGER
ncbi:hypothetical protein PENTCL1PPCAC_21646, partial [Pristionchus entomophagus]